MAVSYYPPAHNDTYVKQTNVLNAFYYAYFATNPTKSLTGTATTKAFHSLTDVDSKVNIDLGSSYPINQVYLENFHISGGTTDEGVKTFRIYGATDSTEGATAFANTTVGDHTGLTLVHSGDISPAEHVAADTADPQYFVLDSPGSYRYYIIEVLASHDLTWPDGGAFRRIELQVAETADITLPGITLSATSPFGELDLPAVTLQGTSPSGNLLLPAVTLSADAGGKFVATLGEVTLVATGDDFTALDITDSPLVGTSEGEGYWLYGSMEVYSHASAALAGTLDYNLTSGINIAQMNLSGELGYELTGGITCESQHLLSLSADPLFQLTDGLSLSTQVLSLQANPLFQLTDGIDITEDNPYAELAGSFPGLESNIKIYDVVSIMVNGTLSYVLVDRISAYDSGDSCYTILTHIRDN